MTRAANANPIPINNPKAAFETLKKETEEAALRVLASGYYIQGPEVAAFERDACEYIGAAEAVAVSSGTEALLIALQELGIGPGDEVIVPSFTFVASATTAARLGAKLVFADIDINSFQMDPASLEAAITPRTAAILAVHLYGYSAPMDAYLAAAQSGDRDIPIVEDAAQAIGTRRLNPSTGQQESAGTLGAWGCFSFYPTKNLPACGEGGLMVTQDVQRANRARQLRNHGQDATYRHALLGGNGRMDALQGAILSVRLPHLEAWNEQRRRQAALYDRLFTESGLPSKLEGFVLPPQAPEGEVVNYHQYTIRVPRRDELVESLRERGITAGVYYPIPLPLQPIFKDLGLKESDFPKAVQASREVASLPIHQFLSEGDVERVVDAIVSFYQGT